MSGLRRTLRRLRAGHDIPPAKLARLEARQRYAVVMHTASFRIADDIHATANLRRIMGEPVPDMRMEARVLLGRGALETVAAVDAFADRDFAAGACSTALAAVSFADGARLLRSLDPGPRRTDPVR